MNLKKQSRHHIKRLVVLSFCTTLLWSCVSTDVVDPESLSGTVTQELEQRYNPVQKGTTGAITLSQAMAMSLVYNFNHRLAMMNTALAIDRARVANYDFLPKVVADAGYRWRTPGLQTRVRNNITANNAGNFNEDSFQQSSPNSEIHARAGLSISLIDFAMAYIRRGELSNQALIAIEERRRVVQNIIHQVRSTYWRAVSAERMLANVNPVMVQLNDALRQSELAEVQRLVPPLEALNYQKSLYRILQQLNSVRRELVNVKTDLAVLINARPGSRLRVLIPHDVDVEGLSAQIPQVGRLETDALRRRPELRKQVYQQRVSVAQGYRSLAGLLPGINIIAGGNYSSSSFLRDNFWFDVAPSASVNLVNIFKIFSQRDINKSRASIEKERLVSVAGAILAQVNIAHGSFQQSIREYRNAEKIYQVNSRILRQVSAAADASISTPLDRIRSEADQLLSQLLLDISFAQVQDAYGRLLVVIGDDPLPASVIDSSDVAQLVPLFETYNRSFGVRYELPVNKLYYNI